MIPMTRHMTSFTTSYFSTGFLTDLRTQQSLSFTASIWQSWIERDSSFWLALSLSAVAG